MSATINVVCYRNKKLANGDSPLMLRVCKDRKTKYKSIGISINPIYWDFDKNRPKSNCPNKDYILKIIIDKEAEYQKKILELKADDKEFTASTLLASKEQHILKTVHEFYNQLITDFEQSNRIGNSRIYKDSLRSLETYYKKELDMPFSHIDVDFLKGYEMHLRKKGCAETSMSVFFRTLRSVYNKAIEAKHAKKTNYPFDEFKISKFCIKTEKRAISKDNIKQIMVLDLSKESDYIQFAKDLFVFSYLCSGINFTDMANLTSNNIIDGRLIYIRQKTGKKINIPLCDEASIIIDKYISKNLSSSYIFPILDIDLHKTETQKYNRKKKVLLKVNRSLKKIAEMTGIKANLSTYTSRHSYATILKNSGVNIALIGETLGHSDLKTTQIYLDSFENSQIDEAMKNLL
ncbi:site-specific integrase [Dysgonomonas sp. 520]|uniref:site-specific integrase n=1 Tax=Dysgonomonas sp. 520 TaxID=2302931 RepID=UPI0013D4C971|nr:site-specific integrase [Dysgonomonas sp. 520]NDW10494.1 site-specific integrase [Dysgonomonas sp. 520]